MVKLLIIGEFFREADQEHNHPFVSSSGIELAKMLYEAGLTHNFELFCSKCQTLGEYPKCSICQEPLYPSPKDMILHWQEVKERFQIHITNVFNFHPDNNDPGEIFFPIKNLTFPGLKYSQKRPISYLQPDMFHHIIQLHELIKALKPNLCLLLGQISTWAVLKQSNISAIRGTISPCEELNIKCLATWSPADIFKNWPNRPIVLADLNKTKREIEYPEIRRLRRRVILNATLDEIKSWSQLPADQYTIDIESGYALFTNIELKNMTSKMRYTLSSQISMIGFARNPTDCLVIEFITRNKPNLSYWQDKNDEIQAWKLVQFLLSKPIPKLFQNGIYDMVRMLYAKLRTNMPRHDTMLLHHSLFPEMKKSLGFLGSIYADEIAWKPMYAKGESLKKDE